MISTSIRAWNVQQGKKPSIFLYQNTPSGIFYISDVEAEISSDLSPIEQLILHLSTELEAITRIEVHAISGLSLELCQKYLDDLQKHLLLNLVDNYNPDKLNDNISRISKEIGNEWLTPQIKELRQRRLLKQYSFTSEGEKATQSNKKLIETTTDLNFIVTAKPFYLFHEKLIIRSDGFENIEVDKDLTGKLLTLAYNVGKNNGIKPLSVGPTSVVEGKEVSNSQFWVTIEGDEDMSLNNAKFSPFITSRSFERWANPDWKSELMDFLPQVDELIELPIKAISETYQMVEEVIIEGLKLEDDKMIWILECDLEMQMLIYNVMPEPIKEITAEVALKLPHTKWKVVLLLRLEKYDDLSDRSLKAGRFHAQVSRRGFTREEGFETWKNMMQEWGKKVKKNEYYEILDTLVEFNCLTERLPDINTVVVNLDNLLSYNRRGRQKWQFNRVRETQELLKHAGINEVIYVGSNKLYSKVDDQQNLGKWVDDERILLEEINGNKIHPALEIARQQGAHYLGNNKIPKSEEFKEMRINSRQLLFEVDKKRVKIPGLEPFYDWRHENLFKEMYNVYYE